MTLKVFSVFDEKAQVFSNPFYMAHTGLALRALADVVSDPKTTIAQHPEDFKLYSLGSFDDNSGHLKSLPQPEFVANAIDFVKAVPVTE